jgi:AcrR family transcriptional regulator
MLDETVRLASMEPAVDRRARRKAETRERLVVAARALFARQGIEATRINELTEEADLGFGSFYNYFDSKDAIVEAVLEQVVGGAGAEIERLIAEIDDPAEVVAVAHRSLVERAARDDELGWLLVRLDLSHDVMLSALGDYAARDLRRGIAQRRFRVPDEDVAVVAAGGALVGVMRAVLEGRADGDAAEAHAAGVLQLFGMSPEEAAEVASRRPAG